MDYDLIVIGGGVVGLACAERMSRKNMSVLLIERNSSFGMETSSRNSEVIHAGIYYPEGSLKASLCVRGNKSLYEWCAMYNIPHQKIGKFIVAVTDEEDKDLEDIFERGRINEVDGLYKVSPDVLSAAEPNVKCSSALWSPSTGIVDSHKLMESLLFRAKENGCDMAFCHDCRSIRYNNGYFTIEVSGPDKNIYPVKSRYIINSGGLHSDKVAASAGIHIDKHDYRLHYSKGHYFRIRPGKSGLVNHLIYPVPQKKMQGLGIHVTKELGGGLKLGPDTMPVDSQNNDYSVSESLKEKFFSAAASYLKGLEIEDISPDQAGIRPKLRMHDALVRDFIINEESGKGLPGLINLIGIESPGLTCCLEIAGLAEEKMGV